MHVKSVAMAMANVSWNLLTATGLRNEISPFLNHASAADSNKIGSSISAPLTMFAFHHHFFLARK